MKWFSDEKGFGLITPSSITRSRFKSRRGTKVSYDPEQGPKGPAAATNVHTI